MDIAKLKRLSAAVIDWASCSKAWLDTSEDVAAAAVGHIDEDGNTYPVATVDCDQYYSGDSLALAHFYAAANPAAVLELIAEVERLRAELAASQARTDSVLETVFKVCEFLGIDYEAARSAPGKPSDVIISAIPKKIADDTALRQAVIRAQEEMRERCAVVCEGLTAELEEFGALNRAAAAIRALEVKP